jgi:hypothetical protein
MRRFRFLKENTNSLLPAKPSQQKMAIHSSRRAPIAHSYRCTSKSGRLSVVLTPAGFEEFFLENGAMSPQEQQNIPRVIEIGKKFGLEILPPPGA